MSKFINLYEAKTQVSALVERAAAGEEIIIAKAGRPLARLTPLQGARSAASLVVGKGRFESPMTSTLRCPPTSRRPSAHIAGLDRIPLGADLDFAVGVDVKSPRLSEFRVTNVAWDPSRVHSWALGSAARDAP